MIDSYDVKRIAGIGAVQALLRSVGSHPTLQAVKVDGFWGPLTLNALNHVAHKVLDVPAYFPNTGDGHELSTHTIQIWYNTQTAHSKANDPFPVISNDGFWGENTFKALQGLILAYSDAPYPVRTGNSNQGVLANILKMVKPSSQPIKPNVRFAKLADSISNSAMMEQILANTMGWENTVVPVVQFVHAGYAGMVAIDTNTNNPVGLIVYQEPSRSAGKYNFQILGIYVIPDIRNFGIGKELVKFVTDQSTKQQISTWIDISIRHPEAPYLISFFTDNGVTVNKQR